LMMMTTMLTVLWIIFQLDAVMMAQLYSAIIWHQGPRARSL
jgi:hypothetical protein